MSQGLSLPNPGPQTPSSAQRFRSAVDVVKASSLPAPLAGVVMEVSKRCRLWRREKIEVARELCGHFTEGLSRGVLPEELVASFGEPKLAARLITQAKKRNRPWAWRVSKRTVQGVFALVLAAVLWYGWNAARYYSGSPSIKFNIQSEMNAAALATPLEERGWPHYRDAARGLKRLGFFEAMNKIEGWPYLKPGTPEWVAACVLHDRAKAEVEMVRQGTRAPRAAYILRVDLEHEYKDNVPSGIEPASSENPTGLGVLLPQLAVIRRQGQVLAFEVRRAAAEGRGADAAADIERMLSLAHHGSEDGTLIAQRVELAVVNLALTTLNWVVEEYPKAWSDAELQRLAHLIGSYAPGQKGSQAWQPDVRLQRRVFEDLLQRFYTDDGEGDGRLCSGLLESSKEFGVVLPKNARYMQPLLGGVVAGRAEMRRQHERLLGRFEAELAKPAYERNLYAVEEEAEQMKGTLGVRNSLAIVMAPSLRMIVPEFLVTRTQRDATAAGLAAELFTRRNGRAPSNWSDLVPALLPAEPVDPWTGKTLVLKASGAENGRPLIYSFGADRVDDGGRLGEDGDPARVQIARRDGTPPLTWDWVLWPLSHTYGQMPMGPPAGPKEAPKPVYEWGWIGTLQGYGAY